MTKISTEKNLTVQLIKTAERSINKNKGDFWKKENVIETLF
jgi:hypothetical protein